MATCTATCRCMSNNAHVKADAHRSARFSPGLNFPRGVLPFERPVLCMLSALLSAEVALGDSFLQLCECMHVHMHVYWGGGARVYACMPACAYEDWTPGNDKRVTRTKRQKAGKAGKTGTGAVLSTPTVVEMQSNSTLQSLSP